MKIRFPGINQNLALFEILTLKLPFLLTVTILWIPSVFAEILASVVTCKFSIKFASQQKIRVTAL